jgi:hypothetical protein
VAESDEAAKGIAHAQEVAKLLRHNIVQGRKVEGKEALREGKSIKHPTPLPQNLAANSLFFFLVRTELRIHDDIERGDNDSVKKKPPPGGGGTVKDDGRKPCS